MMGLSFWKLVVLIGTLAAVWYGFRAVGRMQRARRPNVGRTAPETVAEMQACRVCGTYVVAAAARGCGRADCPY
ncbi:MAG: hypothetical protein AB7G39_10460 [Alphaproteobacteria bacterium]